MLEQHCGAKSVVYVKQMQEVALPSVLLFKVNTARWRGQMLKLIIDSCCGLQSLNGQLNPSIHPSIIYTHFFSTGSWGCWCLSAVGYGVHPGQVTSLSQVNMVTHRT
ncbi:hypothetical protein CHARACLAT_008798 [Characodon lateralis]|uniref:Uncharacterized protein n=1 Tax=Characodon lateralis TaxID=208331 RepID=A0ABU7CLZ6_9TELE|nr:hypothetical protein [Characodon lateralis]